MDRQLHTVRGEPRHSTSSTDGCNAIRQLATEQVPYPISRNPYIRTPSIMPYGLLVKPASVWPATKDPRLNQFGVIDFRLSRQLNAYQREDPPPDHVKPIPFQVILYLATTAFAVGAAAEGTKVIADMVILAFFFLLRPGEYTFLSSKKDSAPFQLMDVCLRRGTHTLV